MAATERLHQQRNAHTQSNPLQTSSVPSTPHQIPRDLRFPSRSPSPGRAISGRRSPRSAVKQTSGVPVSQPAAAVICKFETGAEFRKRRIPYKDGGNEPLPPPSTEPKKVLEPHEEDKLSGDMRELYDRLLPSQESEERRAKLIKKLEKILNDEWPGHDIKVNVFGSSGNLLSSSDSDVDICITTPLKSLESMHSLATTLHQHGMERVVCRAAAKVPIVKIWDPELQLACDMNVNNTLALENTRMIKTYVEIDDRVRPLAKIIKYWTKQRILNDAGK
ncbi:Nucleotidyltransferase [Myriangium duriaei CBS 260.36]|uniref:Nucleotidyltransferase n=1 Tax=Myriangium duriaei CBS 260.36 TaxID=1168546 RepID=A0A9P4J7Y2_9PEZI|nr:Nucleotidyltransferase [Myriangium duriaei CBS 260.36]